VLAMVRRPANFGESRICPFQQAGFKQFSLMYEYSSHNLL